MYQNKPVFFTEAGITCPGTNAQNTATDWTSLSPNERKHALFQKQKDLLDTFLSKGAIDRRQYEKSLTCMAEKMGIKTDKHILATETHKETNL